MGTQFRPPQREERDVLVELGERTGIFAPGEAQELLGQTLDNLFDGTLACSHQAYVLVQDSIIKGWVYFGPTDERTIWNLWWIGVDSKFKRRGFGKALLQFVEETVKSQDGSHLIVETSSSDLLAPTRDFYKCQGYSVSHTEANNYGPGEDKIVFKKKLE
jgi:ribosomal protein S18 acetylase RimI-like enzyme